MTPLGVFPGGDIPYIATAISSNGLVIVGAVIDGTGSEAFRWTRENGVERLGVLPGGTLASFARDVSGDGSVVVGQSPSPPSAGYEAFRWTPDGGMVGLGDLPGADLYSVAYGVSADGSVIVGGGHTGSEEAFLWTPHLGMLNLRDYLISHGVGGLENWRLITAFDVSADGRTIVGAGTNGVSAEAWVATIPEPSTISAIATALAIVGFIYVWTGWRRKLSV